MTTLVTGASGLIGANLCRALLRHGFSVRALVRKHSDLSALDGLPIELVFGDILEAETLYPAAIGCELVFHTASIFSYWGSSETQLDRTALEGVTNILIAAKAASVQRVVLTSSSVVFGSSSLALARSELNIRENGYAPPYCESKRKQELAALSLASELNIDLVVVNPCITVGPHDVRLGPSNAIIISYLSDPFRLTFPGGCNIVSVLDVAEGHVLAGLKGRRGERYLLGSENLEWSLIHRLIADLCGIPGPRVYANHTTSYLAATMQELWAQWTGTKPLATREQAKMVGQFYWYSSAKARTELGYSPRPARRALAEAIAALVRSRHVPVETRRTLAMGKEVYEAQIELERANSNSSKL